MRQPINLSKWKTLGDVEASRSGNGLGIMLRAQRAGAFAKIFFPLPQAFWHKQIKVQIQLRLVDPRSATITFGLSDAREATTSHSQLTADQMLSRVIIENHCGEHPAVFFLLNGPAAYLRFYLEDVLVEEIRPRPSARLASSSRIVSPLARSGHDSV
jgi:hypothetical protein